MRDRIRWGGRIFALLAVVAIAAYLWHAGLNRGAAIASVGVFLVTVVALISPYLFPLEQKDALGKGAVASQVGEAQTRAGGSPRSEDRRPTLSQPEDLPIRQASPGPTHGSEPLVEAVPAPAARQSTKADMEDALLRFSDIDDPAFRLQLLREMGDQLAVGGAFHVAYYAAARDHVFAIVGAIWAFRSPSQARQALINAAERLRPQEAATAQLRDML